MPNYISQIDFGDGVVRKLKAEGGGGTGLYIGDVSDFNADYTSNVKKVTLTWTDPDDIEISGVKQAEWAGTVIVRKEGSVPISSGDGTVVVNSTVKNQYANNGFEDTSIEFDTEYYYRAFPYTTAGQSTLGNYISAEVNKVNIYGVEWDGTATTIWSRTDLAMDFEDPNPYFATMTTTPSSPFDNIMPWSGMQIVEDVNAGTLVSIPKYWYKWTRNGTSMKLQISDTALDGFLVSPAHANRGDGKGERDVVYVGAYHCATGTRKSTTGVQPHTGRTRALFRTDIHNLGSNIWQYDYAMYWTIMMLYLVEYADWNSQAKIGYGCSDSNSIQNSGLCDSMTYHTGTNASSRITYGHVRYRYIEDLWGNVFDWCDGIYFNSNNIYCIKNPANFSDTSGGTLVGTRVLSSGYISNWTTPTASGFEYALYPSEIRATDNTYICDYHGVRDSGVVLYVGGYSSQTQNHGAFYHNSYPTASDNYSSRVGCRLMKLP